MKITGEMMATRDFATMLRYGNQRDNMGNPKCFVIFLQDNEYIDPRISSQVQAITGSCLLPNPMAFQSLINYGVGEFMKEYISYLKSQIPIEFINILIRRLCENEQQPSCNILLFLSGEQREQEDIYIPVLLDFINKEFGISVGSLDPSIPCPPQCTMKADYIPIIAQSMYMFNLINIPDLMSMTPTGVYFQDAIINKIYNEIGNKLNSRDLNSLRQEIYNMKEDYNSKFNNLQHNIQKPVLFERM